MEGKDSVAWNPSNMQSAPAVTAEERPRKPRGFAAMDPERQKQIASKGGRTSHARGTGHEWNSDAAREAGRKGGLAGKGKVRRRRKKAEIAAAAAQSQESPTAPAATNAGTTASQSLPREHAA